MTHPAGGLAADELPPIPARLTFPGGLVGLPDLRRFAVREVSDAVLVELISLDDPSFGVVAAPAAGVREGYVQELRDRSLAGGEDAVLVLLSAHGDPPTITGNLAGPIVVSPDGTARQVVLEGPAFPLRYPLG